MCFFGVLCVFLRFLEVLSLCKGFKPVWRMWILRISRILMIFTGFVCFFEIFGGFEFV